MMNVSAVSGIVGRTSKGNGSVRTTDIPSRGYCIRTPSSIVTDTYSSSEIKKSIAKVTQQWLQNSQECFTV